MARVSERVVAETPLSRIDLTTLPLRAKSTVALRSRA
jgi:hypothetical protein